MNPTISNTLADIVALTAKALDIADRALRLLEAEGQPDSQSATVEKAVVDQNKAAAEETVPSPAAMQPEEAVPAPARENPEATPRQQPNYRAEAWKPLDDCHRHRLRCHTGNARAKPSVRCLSRVTYLQNKLLKFPTLVFRCHLRCSKLYNVYKQRHFATC